MKISQLKYFVSAARNLSFTKAAKECYTVQSAISQQLTALEEELGFLLFERNGKSIKLTAAGERYYADTVILLEQLEDNRKNASQVANGLSGKLKVGLCGANQAAFMRSLKSFYKDNPAISIEFCNVSTLNQVEELTEGRYDILYTAAFNMNGREETVAMAELHTSILSVFMNREHPLAQNSKITLKELFSQTNIYAEVPQNGISESTSEDLCFAAGEKPVREIYVADQNISTLLLDFNVGIAVAPEELIDCMPRTIVSRPLEDGQYTIQLGWAYLKNNRNTVLKRFIQYIS